jgi:two-component system, sensor histidine kinase RegB
MNGAFEGSPRGVGLARPVARAVVTQRALMVAAALAALLAALFVLALFLPEISLALLPLAGAIGFAAAWLVIRLRGARPALAEQAATDKEAREHYVLGLATLAAGTAHEIGTPLSTMSIIVSDLRARETPPPDWKESIEVLWQQVQTCKRSLSGLAEAADVSRIGETREVLARQLVHSLMARIHLLRPEASIRLRSMLSDPDLVVKADLTLPQALLNLVANAVEASPHDVEVIAAQRDSSFVVEILDRGPGIPAAVRKRLGEPFVSGKEAGRGYGIGVFLANTAIERLGGTTKMLDRENGGTCVQVELPAFKKAA